MPDRPEPRHDATAFREVISQWQLAARTEVKRSSSLPSSMFDACDPMLEARLAESVEAMMNCLHEPGQDVQQADSKSLDIRTEQVSKVELSKLPQFTSDDSGETDVDEGVTAEFFALLVDTSLTGDDAAREAARNLLQQHFDIDGRTDLDDAAHHLQQCVRNVLGARVDESFADDELSDLCQRTIAAIVATTTSTNAT